MARKIPDSSKLRAARRSASATRSFSVATIADCYPFARRAVVAWVESIPDQHLHVSAVTLGELQAGVEITREQDPTKAAEIEAWIGWLAGL